MGVVTVSSSASRTPLGVSSRFLSHHSPLRRPFFLAFKTDKSKNSTLVAPRETIPLPIDGPKDQQKNRKRRNTKPIKRVKAVSTDGASPSTMDLDYNEAAAKLENIYKLSPGNFSEVEDSNHIVQKRGRKRNRVVKDEEEEMVNVVKNRRRKTKRLSLERRIALKKRNVKEAEAINSRRTREDDEAGYIEKLVKDYTVATNLVSLDWKKMKIPPVLPSSEHSLLFNLMQPMKALLKVKDDLCKDLGQEPTDAELATSTNMSVKQMRRQVEIGQAARNKLIKHNLRLVLFVINKYYQEIASGPKFQDLCQAGAKGLIVAIDRFELKRGNRLSTYGLFWIRHAIMRSLTASSFTKVPFGLESVRQVIQKAKLELLFEHGRLPTVDEIVAKVGISPERYHDVMRASKQVASLNARHATTQEEFIKGITDIDGVGGDKRRQPTLLRLALDDVLDSLKPKESLVIRQRYGLDGKGDRTLGEIAGNLNISREMVRKYEVKALMKLKHPARVDYLRQYTV